LKDEQVKLLSDMEQKHSSTFQEKIDNYMKQIESLKLEKIDAIEKLKNEQIDQIQALKEDHIREKQELKEEINKLESFLLESKLISTEKSGEAKDLSSRFKEITNKYEELIQKVEDLQNQNRAAQEDISSLNRVIDGLSSWKEENKAKIEFYDKLSILMEQDPLFKTFLIVQQVGSINLDDLRNAIGVPIVQVKKHVQKLQDIDLLEINELGKISVKKSEE